MAIVTSVSRKIWCELHTLSFTVKEAMKVGVGFFNKQASEVYMSLQQRDRERLATLSYDTSSGLVSDKKKSAAKIIKIVHKKVFCKFL